MPAGGIGLRGEGEMRRTRWRWVLLVVGATLLLVGGGLVSRWLLLPGPPLAEARAALASDDRVLVRRLAWWEFRPAVAAPRAGLVFYPGAFVDPVAYAPAARELAQRQFLVAVVPMPLGIALLGSERAAGVMAATPEVSRWAVGGHSLGGVAAAAFARRHPELVRGLVLWASYPNGPDDLSRQPIAVVSVFGEFDPLTSPARARAAARQLPPDTRFVEIAGGNHSQFGWYADQPRDVPARISRAEQQAQVIAATAELLERIARS